jgi:hypothetical protein
MPKNKSIFSKMWQRMKLDENVLEKVKELTMSSTLITSEFKLPKLEDIKSRPFVIPAKAGIQNSVINFLNEETGFPFSRERQTEEISFLPRIIVRDKLQQESSVIIYNDLLLLTFHKSSII